MKANKKIVPTTPIKPFITTHRCSCSHAFQDERYGYGERVMTPGKGANTSIKWRCTVCSKEH